MDQTLLLEESWSNLFLLSLAQWNVHIDEGTVFVHLSEHYVIFHLETFG